MEPADEQLNSFACFVGYGFAHTGLKFDIVARLLPGPRVKGGHLIVLLSPPLSVVCTVC